VFVTQLLPTQGRKIMVRKKNVWGMAAVVLVFGLALKGCGSLASAARPQGAAGTGAAGDVVLIPGGTFIMGSPAGEAGRYDDEVQHEVTVSSFYMGKHEVTEQEYVSVMGTNPVPSHHQGPNFPVTRVSWYDAVEYCNKRSEREGLTPAYTIDRERRDPGNTGSSPDGVYWTVTWDRSADGYRLPTEAEWEYACRAGTTTAYYTGNTIGADDAWYEANSDNRPKEVGKKPANPWGLYDMHGNVSEWCWDWDGDYGRGAQTDPAGAPKGDGRIKRDGSRVAEPRSLRSAFRDSINPDNQYRADVGFRVGRSAVQ
jgi:formylglycine-generating enzyme required for sulfatase activity